MSLTVQEFVSDKLRQVRTVDGTASLLQELSCKIVGLLAAEGVMKKQWVLGKLAPVKDTRWSAVSGAAYKYHLLAHGVSVELVVVLDALGGPFSSKESLQKSARWEFTCFIYLANALDKDAFLEVFGYLGQDSFNATEIVTKIGKTLTKNLTY